MSQKTAKPLNNTDTLAFYIPYKDGCNSIILNRLKYNDTFFNIDFLNNYFAFLTKEHITTTGGGQNIGIINGSVDTYQYLLHIIRISPGYYKDNKTVIEAINKSYQNSYTSDEEKETKENKPLIGYLNDEGTGYIEDINEEEQIVHFTKDIIPVNLKLKEHLTDINASYSLINDNIIDTKYIKEITVFNLNDNQLIFDTSLDNNKGIEYFNDFLSYNNNGFNTDISLGNYLTNINYIINVDLNYVIPIIRGSYVNDYCYMSSYIVDPNGNEILLSSLEFNNMFSSRKKLNIKNIFEINIKYSYKNNINELISNNVNTFNIIAENKNISSSDNFIITINKKLNLVKSGIYVYCEGSDKVSQILTNNYCFLYYSYLD